jgi:ribosomal protein L37E
MGLLDFLRILRAEHEETQELVASRERSGRGFGPGRCRNCGRELLYNVDTECCAGCYGSFMRKVDHRIKHHRY